MAPATRPAIRTTRMWGARFRPARLYAGGPDYHQYHGAGRLRAVRPHSPPAPERARQFGVFGMAGFREGFPRFAEAGGGVRHAQARQGVAAVELRHRVIERRGGARAYCQSLVQVPQRQPCLACARHAQIHVPEVVVQRGFLPEKRRRGVHTQGAAVTVDGAVVLVHLAIRPAEVLHHGGPAARVPLPRAHLQHAAVTLDGLLPAPGFGPGVGQIELLARPIVHGARGQVERRSFLVALDGGREPAQAGVRISQGIQNAGAQPRLGRGRQFQAVAEVTDRHLRAGVARAHGSRRCNKARAARAGSRWPAPAAAPPRSGLWLRRSAARDSFPRPAGAASERSRYPFRPPA